MAVFRIVTVPARDNPVPICKAEHDLAEKRERGADAKESDPIFSTNFHVSFLISAVRTIVNYG